MAAPGRAETMMSETQQILVPDDFSECSRVALDYAVSFAERIGARIALVHAYGLPHEALAAYEMALPEDLERAVREAAEAKLREDLSRVESAGIAADSHLARADAPHAIVDAAARLEARWIVMGTHGHSGIEQLLLGSVAERVLRLAPCPVISVRPPSAGRRTLQLKKILVPTDFSAAARRALDVAQGLARSAGAAEIQLLHSTFVSAPLRSLLEPDSERKNATAARGVHDELERWLEPLRNAGLSASYALSRERPEQAIVEAARLQGADLIAMGTHGRTGLPHALLGSVAERVVRAAPCPTLTTRP